MANIVSINVAATIFGCARQTLSGWIELEGAPVVSRGSQGRATRVDTVALFQWLCDRQNSRTPMQNAQLGKIREEVKFLELQRIDRQGQLCPAHDVDHLFAGTMAIIRASFEDLPQRLAPRNKALRQRWKSEIEVVVDSASVRLKRPNSSDKPDTPDPKID